MSLSDGFKSYGVHSLTLYDRTTFLPFGIIKILGTLALNQSGALNDLFGGSSLYPFSSKPGQITPELTGTIKEYGVNGEIFEKFMGASVTTNAAEPNGSVSTIVDRKGTSMTDGTTGIASVSAVGGSEADMKTGVYIIKAASATTVDVFQMSDQDFAKGADKLFEDDNLKITASPLTVPDTGGTVTVPGYGIEITGGSGTVAFVSGDTASVSVRKINAGSQVITAGQTNATYPLFGAFITSALCDNGSLLQGQIFKCQAMVGLPMNFNENAWNDTSITVRPLYDAAENKVWDLTFIRGSD